MQKGRQKKGAVVPQKTHLPKGDKQGQEQGSKKGITQFAGVDLPTEVPTGHHTEVRFTRPMQALLPTLLAALFISCAVLFSGNLIARMIHGGTFLWWLLALAILFLFLGVLLIKHGLYCLKHAYLILSPVGIEIFPLRKPEKTFRVLSWADIEAIHWEPKAYLLQIDLRSGGGVFLSLKPLLPHARPMLKRVLEARAQELQFTWRDERSTFAKKET